MRAPTSEKLEIASSASAALRPNFSKRSLATIDPQLLSQHKVVVAIYIVLFLVLSIGLSSLEDVLYIGYRIVAGRSVVSKDFHLPSYTLYKACYVGVFVLSQLALLWGIGAVRIGRGCTRTV